MSEEIQEGGGGAPASPNVREEVVGIDTDLNLPEASDSMLDEKEGRKAQAHSVRAMPMDIYIKMARELRRYHAVFNKFWEIGRPLFVRDHPQIQTAAVSFGKEGELLDFYYAEEFWDATSWYERLFTTCHEMLHVLLNHGVRTRNLENRKMANIAADLVVNHLLVAKFKFIRELLQGWWRFAWVDTVFPSTMKVPTDESLEFYYDLLMKNANEIKIQLVDQHMFGEGDGEGEGEGNGDQESECGSLADPDTAAQVVAEVARRLRWQDKKDLDPVMKEHGDPQHTGKKSSGQQAGDGHGGVWTLFTDEPRKKKQKWETIVFKWCRRKLQEVERMVPQWIFEDRRYTLLPRGKMFLPTDSVNRERFYHKRKVRVVMFLDNSGSCASFAERFFRAAQSIPEDKFDLTVCCYDTVVYKLDLKELKMIGGGGTSYPPREKWIQKQIASGEMEAYPDLVFDLTDGYGDAWKAEHPDRWVFFLTDGHSTQYIPEESRYYLLSEFE